MKIKKLRSIFAMGCLTSVLALSSVSYTYASDQVKNAEELTAGPSETENTADSSDSPNAGEQVMSLSDGSETTDPENLKEYLEEDPANPQEPIMLASETGVTVGNYQLNHDQVKILNINTGNITINGDTYSQDNAGTNIPWDAKSDAYVIRGKGASKNNIKISSPQTKVTIYLMDLEWSGTITYSQNTEVDFIICGNVVNHSNFLTSAQNKNLTIEGLTPEGNSIYVTSYLFNSCSLNNLLIENIEINANICNYEGAAAHLEINNSVLQIRTPSASNLPCNLLLIDHSKVTNLRIQRTTEVNSKAVIIRNQSEIKKLDIYYDYPSYSNVEIGVDDSIADDIACYYYSTTKSIYKLIAKDSDLYLRSSPVTTLDADKCNIVVENNLAFKNLIANSCNIKGAFSGTPVDYEANDLYLKTLRLREHPNEYVSVSVDGAEKVRFLTDMNGCLYPYIKGGSASVTVTTEDGVSYSADFDPIWAHDKNVTILTPGGGSEGGGGGTEALGKPVIDDTSLTDLYINPGSSSILNIWAESMTTPSDLSYQWYKDGVPIPNEKEDMYRIRRATAEHAGVYCCHVTDNNNHQESISKEVVVTVNIPADPEAPVILGQSSDMELVAGSSVTLRVDARPAESGSSLFFQWYKGTEALEGKTSRILALKNVRSGDAGSYHCVIIDKFSRKETNSPNTVIKIK